MLTPSEVEGPEVETDCAPEGDAETLLCWSGVLPRNNSLNSWFAAQTSLEGFCFKCSLIRSLILHKFETSFLFPESGYEVIYTYCKFHKEGEMVVCSECTNHLV